MDFILLIFLSTLILLYLPKMLGEQTEREFDDRGFTGSECSF